MRHARQPSQGPRVFGTLIAWTPDDRRSASGSASTSPSSRPPWPACRARHSPPPSRPRAGSAPCRALSSTATRFRRRAHGAAHRGRAVRSTSTSSVTPSRRSTRAATPRGAPRSRRTTPSWDSTRTTFPPVPAVSRSTTMSPMSSSHSGPRSSASTSACRRRICSRACAVGREDPLLRHDAR